MRLVGFNSKHRRTMGDYMDKKEAIQLSDCEIKKARRGEKMEVVLKGSTTISGSPKKSKCPA